MTEEEILYRLRISMLQQKLLAKARKGAKLKEPSEAEVREYYEKNKRRFAEPELRNLNMVLTKTEAEARQAKAALQEGQSFKRVAERFSMDELSKRQGGKLLLAEGRQSTVPGEAAFKARTGELQGPVKTPYGYYVFEVTQVTPASQPSLAQAERTVRNQLRTRPRQKAIEDYEKRFQAKYRDKTVCADGVRGSPVQERPEAVARMRALMSEHRHHFGLPIALLLALLPAALAGCGGDDDNGEEDGDRRVRPVAGTFVSKVQGSEAFVSVVAAPRAKGQSKRVITVLACDGEDLCELYSGAAAANSFTLKPAGGEGEAKGELTAKAASGTIEPPDGDTLDYRAVQATATSGFYDLTVTRDGRLRGASASGVALKGNVELPPPGSGTLRLADGNRVRFEVAESSGDVPGLRPGQLRLIMLPDRRLRGAGKSRGGGQAAFFVRSSK
jgi:hypothetical protein